MSTIRARLDDFEVRLHALERELRELRSLAEPEIVEEPLRVEPPAEPASPPVAPEPAAWTPPPWSPPPPREPLFRLPAFDPAELLGARALALAGGVVTLLGIVFFFVLASNRGWIGPAERVLLGGIASALVFAGGALLRHRYGQLHAALAAVGAGLAGGYTTLLAAAVLYELVPGPVALLLAAGIAALGLGVALAWSSEIVAGLGLLGAMLVPPVVIAEGGTSRLGTAFVAVVFAAAAAVAVERRWTGLLVAAGVVSAPQIVYLVAQDGSSTDGRLLALAAAFPALYLAGGVARQLRGSRRLDGTAAGFVLGAAGLTLGFSFELLDGSWRGVALLAAAAVYGAIAVALFRHEIGALAAAAGLAVGAVAVAQLLGGPALVVAWSAEAVALAWLGRRLAETRFQVSAVAYLVLAAAYAVAHEAPPTELFDRLSASADGVPALLAVVAGAAGFAWLAREWPAQREREGMAAALERVLEAVRNARGVAKAAAFWSAGAFALYASLLGTLAALSSFDWGHVAVTAVWAATGVGIVAAGARLRRTDLALGGVVVLTCSLVSFAQFTLPELADPQRAWAAAILGGGVLAAAVALELGFAERGRLGVGGGVGLPLAAPLAAYACIDLLDGRTIGVGLLGVAGVYGALAAVLFGRRNLATLAWGLGLAFGVVGSALVISNAALVGAWAAAAVALVWLGVRVREPRLEAGAVALLGLAGGETLLLLAPPNDFLLANGSPGHGAPALALLVAAVLASLPALREPGVRRIAPWIAGGLGLYAVSLLVLGLVEALSSRDLTTEFQRGHTAVSAVWGVVALSLLVVGLRGGRRSLRLAGLGLFGVALAKLFLYDLSTLSSITRALSFLAVGAVLLLAGLLTQQLSAQREERSA